MEKNFALKQNKNPYLITGSQITVLLQRKGIAHAVTSRNINLAYQKNKAAREEEKKIVAEYKNRDHKNTKKAILYFSNTVSKRYCGCGG